MQPEKIIQKLERLPPKGQRQVTSFINLLHRRYQDAQPKKLLQKNTARERFIGIWADRADLKESVQWIRKTRQQEWATRN